MAEIAFERLLMGLSAGASIAQRGAATDPPTFYLPIEGSLTPRQSKYRPAESRGHLAEYTRSKTVRRWAEWEGEGPLDVYFLPMLLNMILRGGVTTPATPPLATNARLWTFEPNLTADDLRSATIYTGDPNVQSYQAIWAMVEEFSISADATGEDGATMSVSGFSHFPTKTAPASVPAQVISPLIVPGNMELWLDTGSDAIGTTAITGRFLTGEFSLSTGVTRKWGARGTSAPLNYIRTGRGKRHAELRLVFELLDMDQYDLFADNDGNTPIKARWRLNGPEIEDTFFHFVEVDMYGPFDTMEWGEHEGSNRTIELTILSEYDVTEGWDFAVRVQSDRATL